MRVVAGWTDLNKTVSQKLGAIQKAVIEVITIDINYCLHSTILVHN